MFVLEICLEVLKERGVLGLEQYYGGGTAELAQSASAMEFHTPGWRSLPDHFNNMPLKCRSVFLDFF
jgi:hypothetical protein